MILSSWIYPDFYPIPARQYWKKRGKSVAKTVDAGPKPGCVKSLRLGDRLHRSGRGRDKPSKRHATSKHEGFHAASSRRTAPSW
jgi:hypothetical protein